jgi:endonuclease/exonuclease/phosphatase family metal-dependent hydrolase
MIKITIATSNLQSGVAMTKGHFQHLLIEWKYWLPHSNRPIYEAGKMLKEEYVDIACITEISEKSLRTGFNSQTKILKDSSGMLNNHFFSPQKFGKFFFHEGKAIYSKYKIIDSTSHPLSTGFMRTTLDETTIEIESKKIKVFAVHLALIEKHREKQIKEITEILKNQKDPIILAGDFNERNPEKLETLIQNTPLKHKYTLKTFPSWNPQYQLDYILLSDEFTVSDCHIPKSKPFSDHSALIVKAELK